MRYKPSLDTPTARGAVNIVVFACAGSAGVHAGLVPEHLRTEPRLGIAFIVTVLLLLAVGYAAAIRSSDRRIVTAAALLLAGLIAAYWASRSTGIPLLAPDAEAVDVIGVITIVVEALGLMSAVAVAQSLSRRRRRPTLQEVPR
jgi:hypothetical protein